MVCGMHVKTGNGIRDSIPKPKPKPKPKPALGVLGRSTAPVLKFESGPPSIPQPFTDPRLGMHSMQYAQLLTAQEPMSGEEGSRA